MVDSRSGSSAVSRLIVKNLPPTYNTDEKLRSIFGKFGTITDASLKYTGDGKFRRFAFVGFDNEQSCRNAIAKINNTFVQGFKLMVEECQRFNAENKPRPWSKYTKGTSAYKRLHPDGDDEQEESGSNDVAGPSKLGKSTNVPNKKAKIEKESEKQKKNSNKTEKINAKKQPKRTTDESQNLIEGEEKEDATGTNAKTDESKIEEKILDTGRLFVRNLPYICTEQDLRTLFEPFGLLTDLQCIVDKHTSKCKGFAIVTFMFPDHALAAYKELDASIFKGRMLHILPGEERVEPNEEIKGDFALSQFQKDRVKRLKKEAKKATHTWNALFLGSNAVADQLAEKFEIEKRHLLMDDDGHNSGAVRMAMAETKLVKETRDFFLANGVCLDAFSHPAAERSKQVLIVKNLPSGVRPNELQRIFSRFGEVKQVLMPPVRGISALVEMGNEVDAKRAFEKMAYYRLNNQPLYLEWAPFGVFDEQHKSRTGDSKGIKSEKAGDDEKEQGDGEAVQNLPKETDKEKEDPTNQKGRTKILVRNVPFQANQKELRQLFSAFGELKFVRMPKKPGTLKEHRGFCFVDFYTVGNARQAFESLVHSTHLYGRRLVLEWAKQDDSTEEIMQKSANKLTMMRKKNRKSVVSKKQIAESIGKFSSVTE